MEFINRRRMPKLTKRECPVVAEGMGVGRLKTDYSIVQVGREGPGTFDVSWILKEFRAATPLGSARPVCTRVRVRTPTGLNPSATTALLWHVWHICKTGSSAHAALVT